MFWILYNWHVIKHITRWWNNADCHSSGDKTVTDQWLNL